MKNIGILSIFLYVFLLCTSNSFSAYIMPFAVLGATIQYFKKREIKIGYPPLFYTYLFIFITGIIFNYFSESGITGVKSFINSNSYFLSAYLFLNCVDNDSYSDKKLNWIINTFILGGVILSLLCFRQFYFYFLLLERDFGKLFSARVQGLAEYYYVGHYLMLVGIMTFSKLYNFNFSYDLNKKNDKLKTYLNFSILIIANLIIFEGMLLSKTRASIYAYFFAYISIVLFRFNLKKLLIYIPILFMVYFGNPNYIRGFSQYITVHETDNNPRQASDNLRRIMIDGAINTYKSNPIIGIGNGELIGYKWIQKNNLKLVEKDDPLIKSVDRKEFISISESHNMYLNMLMKNGLLILAFLTQFFIFIPIIFFKTIKKIKENSSSEYEWQNIGAIAGIGCFLIVGMAWSVWIYLSEIQEIFHFLTFILLYHYCKYFDNGTIKINLNNQES